MTPSETFILVWFLVVLPIIAAGLTGFNLLTLPRSREPRRIRRPMNVSVLIPARNESANIATAVRHSLACPEAHEVLVYNDRSTDDTADQVRQLSSTDARAQLIEGEELPHGWAGKPHACHNLGQAATGDVLLFVDADTMITQSAAARVLDLLERYEADVVTAVPRQTTTSLAEKLVVPLLHLTYTSWLPAPLVWWSRDPRFLAANGQIMAIRRTAWTRLGGYRSVRSSLVDDMAIATRAKQLGLRVVFADGTSIATTRMYRSAREVWEGFSKNIRPGIGTDSGVLLACGVYMAAFVLPWIALAASLTWPPLTAPAIAGIGLNLLQRTALAIRFDHPAISVLLHPLGVVILIAIALNSIRWTRQGRIQWAGRIYATGDGTL